MSHVTKHDVVYDIPAHTYIVKKDKLCSLVPMGEEHFISRRKDSRKRIKEAEDAKKNMVKATEISVVTIQSIDGNIAEKDDPKPRTILIQGGEDDMTTHNLTTVADIVTATTNEENLVAETCIHQE